MTMTISEWRDYVEWLRLWKSDKDIQELYECACEDGDVQRMAVIVQEADRRHLRLL
jgi:hypothetical protein